MRILLYDLETAPMKGWFWGDKLYEQDIIEVESDSFILCFAYQWNHEDKVHWVGQPQFSSYKEDKSSDTLVVKRLWELFKEADVLIAHNGKSFDNKVANTRFLLNGLPPPNHHQVIDTKLVARKYFRFPSNKLDELSRQLEKDRKLPHTGKKLWFDCMKGNREAWKTMKEYNIHDVSLLKKTYDKFLPWIDNHPNWNLFDDRPECCPNCGSARIQKCGLRYNLTTVRQKFSCRRCKHIFSGESVKRSKLRP